MQDFEVSVIGHDNRTSSLAEVERARARAARGDKEALALIASVNGGQVAASWQHHNLFGNAENLLLSASTNAGGTASRAPGYVLKSELTFPAPVPERGVPALPW